MNEALITVADENEWKKKQHYSINEAISFSLIYSPYTTVFDNIIYMYMYTRMYVHVYFDIACKWYG